jgi:hypothetical protein
MAAVEAFTLDVRRKVVLSRGKLSPADAIRRVIERGNMLALTTTVGGEQADANRLSNSPSKTRKSGRKAQEQ